MIPTKICGITNVDDAIITIKNGASAIGLIFYEKSPRAISTKIAKIIANEIPGSVTKVGVFVNHDTEFINEAIQSIPLDMVQLHGDESPEYCKQFDVPVIKALRVKDKESLSIINDYEVKAILLDTFSKDKFGGTGESFDWSLLKEEMDKPIILSGGLNPDNILIAIESVYPSGIDVNSGVEKSPGIKDHKKIEALFQKLINTQTAINVFTDTLTQNLMNTNNNYEQI